MKNKSFPIHQQGFVNIGLALGISLVVVAFLAPLGLYYVNMYNQNEQARLKTQSQEVVEGLGKMIYNAYVMAPLNTSHNCPTAGPGGSDGSSLSYVKTRVDMRQGQNKGRIKTPGTKNMAGRVSGQLVSASEKPVADRNRVAFCLPSSGPNCLTIEGRSYCFDFGSLEVADGNILDVPIYSYIENPTLFDSIRGRLATVASHTASWIDTGLGTRPAVADALVGGSFPHFSSARIASKGERCHSPDGDPATLDATNSRSNYCVTCSENAVVCVRFSMCVAPGSSEVHAFGSPSGSCSPERHRLQGVIAMFPERI